MLYITRPQQVTTTCCSNRTRCGVQMERGSEVWVWTGQAFERGKVVRLEEGVVHVTLAGGMAMEAKNGNVHLTNNRTASRTTPSCANSTKRRRVKAPIHPGPSLVRVRVSQACASLGCPRRLCEWLATPRGGAGPREPSHHLGCSRRYRLQRHRSARPLVLQEATLLHNIR